MPNMLRNVLAVVAGIVVGSAVNMALIALDLLAACLPMAWLAIRIGSGMRQGKRATSPIAA